ncbi:MAG: hypothetical protein L0287_37880, partial [Anaerolineae bacterium]|nr:hypothetical protein [Anaerolineae bacterium]
MKRSKPLLITGNWQQAEIEWGDLKRRIDFNDTNEMAQWIDLQVQIVDGAAGDRQRLLLRKLAFQELYYHPWSSIRHRQWV